MKNIILKHCLKNMLDFGNVNPKVVLGLILRDSPELKKNVPNILKEINSTKKEIKEFTKEQILDKLKKIAPDLLKKTNKTKEKKKGQLKPLKNAIKGKVVVRIAPSPSGPLHIGHAYGISLNYEYAKMYDGKLILRIEDTNPEKIYNPAYKMIEKDVRWICDNDIEKVIIQSDRLGIYYDYAEKLVQKGKGYICRCDPDEWRTLKNNAKKCPCRDLDKKENLSRYLKMFNEYAEGEAVLRLKTDIKHKNPAMRDFGLLRINEYVHPRTGKEQKVWPLMVFSVAIDDHELGITHVLNGKDQADNSLKEIMIIELFGWKSPEYQHWGKINFTGFKLKTSTTKIEIEQNEYTGWDDIRLPFLPALKKRGYQPESFRKFSLEIGLSLNDKKVTLEEFWKNINAFNKEMVEPKAHRYFFVDSPKLIKIKNAPKKEIDLDLHPDFPSIGKRHHKTHENFYISEQDYKQLGDDYLHRLMDCINFKIRGKNFQFDSENYDEYKNSKDKGKIIHWLPEKETIDVTVVMDTGKSIDGKGEKEMMKLEVGEIVQLERRYFARLVNKEKNKLTFWYLHK